jgi:P-type Cu+ transporter
MEETFGLQDYGDNTAVLSVDPVCGMTVDESKAAGKAEYAGQIYSFCSKQCQKDFEEDPGLFIGQHR